MVSRSELRLGHPPALSHPGPRVRGPLALDGLGLSPLQLHVSLLHPGQLLSKKGLLKGL